MTTVSNTQPHVNESHEQALRENLTKTLSLINSDTKIEYGEPDYIKHVVKTPNVSCSAEQWSYNSIPLSDGAYYGVKMPDAWDITTGSGVNVAVIDSGIVPHSALAGKLLPGRNYIITPGHDQNDPTDLDNVNLYQCAHVAGTVGAEGNVISGAAWNSKIIPIKVCGNGDKGGCPTSGTAQAIRWAVNLDSNNPNPNVAKVINMSFGGLNPCSCYEQEAINDATARGAIIVVAAGNNNLPARESSPANCNNVITVGSTD